MNYLDDLDEWLKNFSYTNLAKNRAKYINPNVSVAYDPDTKYAGYAPNSDLNSIVLNPNSDGGQYGALGTWAHEMAHTAQPHPLRVLNGLFGTPGWQLRGVSYPYYDNTDHPNTIEKAASLRESEAMGKAGNRWWDSVDGQDVLGQLKSKYQYGKARAGYTEEQIKGQIEALLYPPDPRKTYRRK